MSDHITDRLQARRPLLLDGATGTELARHGLFIETPEWSARALWSRPDVILGVHQKYVAAGAEIITANTFRTHARNLKRTGRAGEASELTRRAVELARRAAGGRAWVAGSQAPLEDCYSPELTPDDADLEREHEAMACNLAAAGVDLILVETQHSIREAVVATRAATATGVPVIVSFVCGSDGQLLSGESVSAAASSVVSFHPAAILANCVPVSAVPRILGAIQHGSPDCPCGAYANVGFVDEQRRWINTDSVDPDVYAKHARRWLDVGALLIGGCCGTTPAHIARLRRMLTD